MVPGAPPLQFALAPAAQVMLVFGFDERAGRHNRNVTARVVERGDLQRLCAARPQFEDTVAAVPYCPLLGGA